MLSLCFVRRFAARALCAGVMVLGAQAMAQQDKNLGKIMPMGDSITAGDWTGGYRTPLGQALEKEGYKFQFIGSSTVNSRADWGPWLIKTHNEHHEGHAGFTITQIEGYRDGIDNNLASYIGPDAQDPNFILLMIGTNDIVGGRTQGAPDRLSTLITHISDKKTGLRPDAHLIVASIPPAGENPGFSRTAREDTRTFNTALKEVVLQHQKLGENVTYLDLYSYLTEDDLGADKLHPTQEGYAKIAAAWLDGIHSVLAGAPTTQAVVLPSSDDK